MAAQDCGPPERLVEYAWQVHELTRVSKVRKKFGEMLRQWAVEQWELQERITREHSSSEVVPINQNTKEEHVYTPTPEERPDLWGPRPFCFGPTLTLAARYAVAALIHDFCIARVREQAGKYVRVLNPWGVERDREVAIPPVHPSDADDPSEFTRGRQMFLAALCMTMPHLTGEQEPMIRECVAAVRSDLGKPRIGF